MAKKDLLHARELEQKKEIGSTCTLERNQDQQLHLTELKQQIQAILGSVDQVKAAYRGTSHESPTQSSYFTPKVKQWSFFPQYPLLYFWSYSLALRSLKKFKKRSPEVLKPRSKDTRRTSGNTTRNDPFPPFLIIEAQTQVIEQVAVRSGMDSKVAELTMSSPNHSTSDIEDAFSSMNILNYTLVSPDYFPASSGSKLLPPKKQIHPPSSSSTTLSNSSRNQTCDLVSPSFSVYTPTPPQIFEIGKSSIKMHLKHHEEQIEDILNYLDELSFHHIEKMEEGRINRMIIRRNGNELKTELKRIRTQIIKLHKKQLGQKDKIAFAHYRISNLEQIIEEIQARHQTNQEDH
ncbi:hypothetical protein Tco_0168209 [Tanacetum coccineum]